VNEDPTNLPNPKPQWSHGIIFFRPLYLRFLFSAAIWLSAFALTCFEHMCGLGYKTAERLAPFVVATLAALSIACIRRYRFGVPLAIAIIALYLLAIFPAYSHWIHGTGRHHFPGAVPELPDFPEVPPSTPQ